MKPFIEESLFRHYENLPTPVSKSFTPDINFAQGVELRRGRDVYRASSKRFISSGKWTESSNDGLIDQEVQPAVLGETIDPLDYEHFNDVVEIKTPAQVLIDEEIIRSNTIDYDAATSKDGRITVFKLSTRSYLTRDEVPFDSRGVKTNNESIDGYSVGTRKSPFIDEGESLLGITKLGYYGIPPEVKMTFYDTILTSSLGTTLNYDSFDQYGVYGSFGRDLYSAIFETDSVTYAGMLR
jgi:hypothetical protein